MQNKTVSRSNMSLSCKTCANCYKKLYCFAQNTRAYFLRDTDTHMYSLTIDAKDNIYVCVWPRPFRYKGWIDYTYISRSSLKKLYIFFINRYGYAISTSCVSLLQKFIILTLPGENDVHFMYRSIIYLIIAKNTFEFSI